MPHVSTRYRALLAAPAGEQVAEDAVVFLKKNATAKFDETVEAAIRLNLEKRHNIRDTVTFPNAFGKQAKVLVFAKGKKAEDARAAGADFVGDDELIEKIAGGWTDFDVAIATPDMMKSIAKVARVLGTKGLMPNPKAKTVTEAVLETVKEVKSGRREFRADSTGIVAFPIGKVSMSEEQLVQNFRALWDAVVKKKPSDLKGDYIRTVHMATSMGKGVELNRKNPIRTAATAA